MRVPSSSRRGGKCRHACPPDGACLAKKIWGFGHTATVRQLHGGRNRWPCGCCLLISGD